MSLKSSMDLAQLEDLLSQTNFSDNSIHLAIASYIGGDTIRVNKKNLKKHNL